MKKFILFLIIFTTIFSALGQDLSVPNTPAFSILNFEPSAVMRPSSIKKLSNDILNSFDKDGKLIMNLGIEVSPYWLKSRPNLSRQQYLEPSQFQSFIQTLSLSAATVKDTISGKNNLGIGFRVQIIKGKLADEFKKQDELLKNYETAIGTIGITRALAKKQTPLITNITDAITNIRENINASNLGIDLIKKADNLIKKTEIKYQNNPNDVVAFCEDLINTLEIETTNLAKNIIKLEQLRTGFSLELAGATKFNEATSGRNLDKIGFWVNANNYISATGDAFTITARVLSKVKENRTLNSDIGLGYIKTANDFNIAIEGMLRWYSTDFPDFNSNSKPITRVERGFTYRIAAQLSYAIYENVSVNFSLGKDFESAVFKKSSFFSIFGINYSIFNKSGEQYKILN